MIEHLVSRAKALHGELRLPQTPEPQYDASAALAAIGPISSGTHQIIVRGLSDALLDRQPRHWRGSLLRKFQRLDLTVQKAQQEAGMRDLVFPLRHLGDLQGPERTALRVRDLCEQAPHDINTCTIRGLVVDTLGAFIALDPLVQVVFWDLEEPFEIEGQLEIGLEHLSALRSDAALH